MADRHKSPRQRLVEAAFELFSSQGVGATTTRQVADRAGVNEVTLFRQFGSKHGLLAAVVTEAEVLSGALPLLDRDALGPETRASALRDFLARCLDILEQRSELVRSLIGEAGQFSADQSRSLGVGLQTIRDRLAEPLAPLLELPAAAPLPLPEVVGLTMALLLGYTAMVSAADADPALPRLWPSREAFIEGVAGWLECLRSPVPPASPAAAPRPTDAWLDLPAPVAHQILQAARRHGSQTYALVYVLLGAGVAAEEVPTLTRASAIYDSSQHLLLVGNPPRQVPLNQWILGRRYGTYTKNPLTRWLRGRSDNSPALFIDPDQQPLGGYRLRQLWREVTQGLSAPGPLAIEQARATWCVEMLLKGVSPQALSWLSGLSVEQLAPLGQKAQARSALALALRLDQPLGDGPADLAAPAPEIEPP